MNKKRTTTTVHVELSEISPVCQPEAGNHCITCSDEALPARVLQIDEMLCLAQVEIKGQVTEIDITLVDGVAIGQMLLVHGGVALERLEQSVPVTEVEHYEQT